MNGMISRSSSQNRGDRRWFIRHVTHVATKVSGQLGVGQSACATELRKEIAENEGLEDRTEEGRRKLINTQCASRKTTVERGGKGTKQH